MKRIINFLGMCWFFIEAVYALICDGDDNPINKEKHGG